MEAIKLIVSTTIIYYDEMKLKKQQNESMTKIKGSKKVVASVGHRSKSLLELKHS